MSGGVGEGLNQPPLTSQFVLNSSFCPPSPVNLLKPLISFSVSQLLLVQHWHTSLVEKWLQIQAFFLGFLILLDHGYIIPYSPIICTFKHLKNICSSFQVILSSKFGLNHPICINESKTLFNMPLKLFLYAF